ncbi:MAG: GTP-binding protein [Sulfurimonas sp.]|uniref:Rab family GTPase n=1 Tax=Sulfurimonas sp. TaxID=2022749 RepID=UPI0025D90E4C|nr:Rab family GTPase [Sulfurimonas sp.]MCK9491474.1 GTP-binding protein [Sulfurimonas sp.]
MFAYKVVMVGDFATGKTSLIKRFVDNSFSEEYLSSIGVSISKKVLGNSTMMLWDIEGRTEFKPIFKQYLNGAKGFIIVADLTRKNTIESIQEHIKTSLSVVSDAPICIALNKSDIKSDFSVNIEQIKGLSANIISVFKTSALSGDAVEDLFKQLNAKIIKEIAC